MLTIVTNYDLVWKKTGRILYELSDSLITLEGRRFRAGQLGKEEFLGQLRSCRQMADEAKRCLRYSVFIILFFNHNSNKMFLFQI